MQKCIDCGLCEKICPCLNEKEQSKPLEVYAAVNPDEETRMNSSSGGIFWALAKQTIEAGGIVSGAAFDKEWMVCHSSAETLEDAKKFQGSKYVQSRVTGCYKQVLEALKDGRKVLFSGTACQISALKGLLRTDYENLLTIDVVCHGVPSPGIWREYLCHLGKEKTITNINFRDKASGWRNYDFIMNFSDGDSIKEPHDSNLYMQGYLNNLFLRPSCHKCKFKAGKCGSDITLGDFWGIEKIYPQLDDNRGASVLLANSQKGEDIIHKTNVSLLKVEYEQAINGNPCMVKATPESKWKPIFMEKYLTEGVVLAISQTLKKMEPSVFYRILRRVKRFFHI